MRGSRASALKGGLNLAPNGYGWASGGYIADSEIDGRIGDYWQQQRYTVRNAEYRLP
ncbi:hypothetical protein F0344_23095 [Streptomyces finlayi]|uniref:Uncharacterized protein n=1 Tax=Streptomyces finlayi TaxID=67296 RepID=A0A7G7BP46_9ACTN|nr:hypothetical protein [Streptomyces finlayi]QNE77111.1 hypothetical protein F0344_23095 [Streptomyces finlayi]